MLAGKVFFDEPPDRIWFAGQRFWPAFGYSGRPRGYGRRDGPRYRRPYRTDRAAGAFMAASRQVVDAVGLLDDDLFAYVEDVDWCCRARAAGFEIWFVPDALAWHRVSASTGGERASTHALYYGVRNTIAVSERHLPLRPPLRELRRWLILAVFLFQAFALSERRRPFAAAVRDGYRDALAGRFGERPVLEQLGVDRAQALGRRGRGEALQAGAVDLGARRRRAGDRVAQRLRDAEPVAGGDERRRRRRGPRGSRPSSTR